MGLDVDPVEGKRIMQKTKANCRRQVPAVRGEPSSSPEEELAVKFVLTKPRASATCIA